MRPVVPVILALLAVLLAVGTLRARPDDDYRIERFYYRVNPPKRYTYEAFFTPELDTPKTPAFYEGLVIEPFDYAAPTAEELGERLWSYNRTYDAFGDPYPYRFNHDEWSERVANLRLRERTYAREADEGLIGDISIDWLATTLKITGRKLFVLGYTSKTYENPPDPLLEGTQGDFNMDQETQIRVEGTIAERVTVNVDYDDTRENDSRNKLSLIYTGREDEFIRRAELGDVNLSIPGTRFVSYSAKSLFGAKVVGGLGDWFTFTLIGSREKGVTEEEEFTGTGQLQRDDIRDTGYSERVYYRVDTNPAHFGSQLQIAEDSNGTAQIEVYVYSYGEQRDPTYTYYSLDAQIYSDGEGGNPTDPPVPTGEDPVSSEFWRRLENVQDYYVNKATGRITFNTSLSSNDYVAIKYKVASPSNPTGIIYSVGYNDSPPELVNPKLVKSGIINPLLTDYMYHNIYFLGATGLVNDSDFILDIFDLQDRANDADDFDGDGDTTEPLVRVFGLTRAADGSDDRININYIDFSNGLLIFPDRYPFQKEGEEGTDEDAYDDSYSRRNHRYDIHVEYHSASAVRFLKPNIIPGSEEVTLNGRRLVRDVDYIIDYDSGYIEFLVPGADSSDADLKIKYEYKPLFGEAGKTLAGGRLEFSLGDVFAVGGTYIGEWTDKPVDELEIPELRAIPSAHQVMDADASLNVRNQFMTDFINLLPFIESKEESLVTLEGEWAYSFYNPNRVGRAHVDDMESAHQSISFPADGDEWGPSSPPITQDGAYDQADRRLMKVGDEEWIRSQINDEWNEDVVRVLVFGGDNARPLPQQAGRWDSVCRIISPNGLDLEEKNLKYLEFYLFRRGEVNGGVLHFDIGLINEDSDGDYTGFGYEGYDTEDEGLHEGISDDLSDPGELDGRLNYSEDERGWTFNNAGDGGIYGTGEVDAVIIGQNNSLLNTEDLDFNLTLDTTEQHFGYALPLADIPEEYLGRDLGNGWLAIRIPLETDETRPGDYMPPVSKIVKAMRIWIEAENSGDFGPDEDTAVLVYNLRLTGIKWEAPVVEPESPLNHFAVGTVNSEDNQDYEPLEQREDSQGFLIREQALDLTYNLTRWNDWGYDGQFGRGYAHPNPRFHDTGEPDSGEGDGILNTEDLNHNGILDPGEDVGWSGYDPDLTGAGNGVLDTEDVIRGYTVEEFLESRDFTTHDRLTVSVNNRNLERSGEDLFFIRFGTDENNYYEAALPLTAPGWNKLEVDFTRLIALRQEYEALDPDQRPEVYTRDNLTVAGSPQLVRVYEIACGTETTSPMSGAFDPEGGPGRVWVNNVDLTDPVVREGQAGRGKLLLKFADVLTVEGSYQKVDGDFQSIGLRRTGVTAEDLDGAATLQLGAFLPQDWRVNMPLSGSLTHSIVYVENIADYEGSVEDLGKTVSDTAKANLTFSKAGWPTLSFTYSDYRGLNETAQRRDHDETASASFDYSIISDLFFVPTKVNARYLYKKDSTDYEEQTGRVDTVTGKDEVTTSVTWQFIRGLSLSPHFSFTDTRDLLHAEPVSYTQNSGVLLSFSRFRLAQPSLDFGTTYSELFNPPTDYYAQTYDVSVSNSLSASLPLSLGTLIEKWFGSWTTNLNYTLRRSSTYDEVTQKPPPEYVWGWDHIWHEAGEPTYSGRGYSYLVSNRFRPLEFFRGFDDPELASYDVLLGEIKYSFSTDLSEAYGSKSRTWTEVWPAAELTITGHRYFPIFASLLQQSTVKLSYQKQTTKWIGVSLSRTYTPGISWRASWSDDLSTMLSYTETSTITDESGSEYGIGDTHRVTNTYNPGASLTYVMELPGSFRIPFLGEDVPLRNELQLTASYNLTIVENSVSGSGQTPPDDTTRHTASLTGGYYLTTNIHANLTLTYEDFTNKTSVGYDYTSFDAKLALELKF